MTSLKSQSNPSKKTGARRIGPVESLLARGRPWLLAGFVALCVARPLVPSEAVSWLGDGHPFTMLLLVITAGCLVLAMYRGGLARPVHAVDAAVAALVLVCVASAVLGVLSRLFGAGNNPEFDTRVTAPRLAINMLWEWVGLGLVFFLARQLVQTTLESRALVAVMIALAVVLSADGMYQVFVSLPAERAAYADNPDAVLLGAGHWFEPNSPERARFENRLNSTEPLATFALANSLAGYLVPWLVVALGVVWNIVHCRSPGRPAAAWIARLMGLGAGIVVILICLLLTKSRSAYLALAVGLVLLPLTNDAFRRLINGRVIALAGIVLALAIGIAVAVGGLDAEVLTEASKSLGYRWQYWQATLDMIANYPTLGVGPGDFQNYYTQYKLPEASEEIRDPHNFLLEVWATAGTFAFLALVAVLAGFAWHTWQLPATETVDAARDEGLPSREARWFVAAGAAAGVLFAYGVGPPFGFVIPAVQWAALIAIGAAVMALLWPWISGGTLPPRLPALGVLVLSIHLLASGGFTFPGVAGTFWILLALGLNRPIDIARGRPVRRLPRWGLGLAATLTVAAVVACYYTAFFPVLASRAALFRGFDEQLSAEGRLAAMEEAAQADPLSAEPFVAIAHLSLEHLRKDPKSELWGTSFLNSTKAITVLRGHSSAAWSEVAAWYREIHELDPEPEMAKRIVQLTRGAAYLYPNSATIQAEYALALAEVDKTPAARRSAAKALELDAATPHADKKLSPQLKGLVEKLLADSKKP
ncbi:MAG: O-antigen ligase family protein [Pirellulales bacterium]